MVGFSVLVKGYNRNGGKGGMPMNRIKSGDVICQNLTRQRREEKEN